MNDAVLQDAATELACSAFEEAQGTLRTPAWGPFLSETL